jgi:membrane carboxypeptidase/penicillin-binding protein PbpC
VLLPGIAVSDQEMPLQAESKSGARLSWFVDGELVGTADAEERVWWLHRVSVPQTRKRQHRTPGLAQDLLGGAAA